ncbi:MULTISPECIES: response regulator transcription factor [unclassified Haladaptatus]|uniref:response regulator transcription factor n=1 Tax=unclassified Haladaptatus TaxID=2622732 RepID=UPI0023E791E4|nr:MULTISPECIES: HalX domain-containing protein [unclassified Haladaptatus]
MGDGDRPVILVVEDEADVAETYEIWLSDDYEVIVAPNGRDALDAITDDVAVVLLDRMMPGLTGDQVLETIRERELDCRVAMVTAVEPDFDIIRMGFDAYLSKPVSKAQLHETVELLLERAEYSTLLQEYYSLAETKAALTTGKRREELEGNEEYQALEAELDAVRTQLNETLGGFTDEADFISALRDIGGMDGAQSN